MLKRAIFVAALLGCAALAEEQWSSPVAGLLQSDQTAYDHRTAIVSPDGNVVAFGTYGGYAFFNIPERSFKWLELGEQNGRLSPDLNFVYGNNPSNGYLQSSVSKRWSSFTRGALSDEPLKQWNKEYYVLGMDAAGNVMASKAAMVSEGGSDYLGSLQGLFLLDRKTGKVLKTLRSETLYQRSKATEYSQFYWNAGMDALLVQTNLDAKEKQVYPLDGGPMVSLLCGRLDNPNVEIGQRYLFTKGGFNYGTPTSYLGIHDLKKGGKELFSQAYPSQRQNQSNPCEPMIFAFKDDHIFRFDRENVYQQPNLVYEEVVENGSLKVVNQWKVDMRGETPDPGQKFAMTVGKGPTLLIYPLSRSAADKWGGANRAYLIDLSSQKLVRYIHPFFNPNAATLAVEARLKKANAEYDARLKKEAADKLAAAIQANWTDKGYKRGRTYFFGASYVIMDAYDAAKDEYRLWRPQQRYEGNGHIMVAEFQTIPGYGWRAKDFSTAKQYRKCEECEGDGHVQYTEYTTKTKELPWGYFSGIETKRISTTATTKTTVCTECHGNGVVLK